MFNVTDEDVIKCSHCKYHRRADIVAALNILGFPNDKKNHKGVFPSRENVVLEGRYAAWKLLTIPISTGLHYVRVLEESPRSA